MRDQHKHDFVLAMFGIGLRKQILQQRDGSEAGNPAQRLCLLVLENSAQEVDLTVLEADFMLDLSLSDDWLIDAADVHARSHGRDVERHLQCDLPPGMHARSNVDIDADIQVLELSIDKRVDSHSTDAGLKRTRCYRHSVANLQCCLLSVQGANLGILDELGVGVAQQRGGGGRWNGDLEVGGVEISQAVEIERVGCTLRDCPPGGAALIAARGLRDIALQRHRCAGGRADAKVAHLVAADLHDGNFHQHFRLGSVEIVHQLLGKRHLIGCAAHYDGALRGQLLNAADLEDGTHGIDDVLQFGGLGKIR